MMSDRKKNAMRLAREAARRFRGFDVILLGALTINDYLGIATRYNSAWAYRKKTGDELGAEYFARQGWTWQQAIEARAEREAGQSGQKQNALASCPPSPARPASRPPQL